MPSAAQEYVSIIQWEPAVSGVRLSRMQPLLIASDLADAIKPAAYPLPSIP